MKNNSVLFVGNGINRAFGHQSWENLIRGILESNLNNLMYEDIKDMPSNMQVIVASNNNVQEEIKKISSCMIKDKINNSELDFLREILRLPVYNIVTTNYTFEFEQALGVSPSRNLYYNCRRQNNENAGEFEKVHLYRYYQPDDCEHKIWHIHGDVTKPTSIILGHYYYGKLVRAIQNYITSFMSIYHKCQKIGVVYKPNSWIDTFLVDDVYMIGFGMDLCEFDIWWLAECKRRNFPDTKIHLYKPWKDIKDCDRILMQSYGIIVENINFDGNYKRYYQDVLKDIRIKMEE